MLTESLSAYLAYFAPTELVMKEAGVAINIRLLTERGVGSYKSLLIHHERRRLKFRNPKR
jgi:hypothetical protein